MRSDILAAVLIGAVICLALGFSQSREVWITGAFFDTDDATRMVQVRDWMAGQAWYDLHMHRLGMADAAPMHWTRLVDAPLAMLIKSASLILDPVMSERAARLVFPFLLSLGVLTTGALVAIELVGASGVLAAVLVLSLSGLSLLQFQPGRIDHHAPQILLLLTSGLFLLRAMNQKALRRSGFLAAACLAASLAIGLENLPEAVIIALCLVTIWVMQGDARRASLNGFGWGLALTTPLLYALTMEPARWFVVACDAQSFMHVATSMAGGAVCIMLTRADKFVGGARLRFLLAVSAGAALLIMVRTAFPQCGPDPFVDVDPLVRREWLNKVREAFSISHAWSQDMSSFALINFTPAVAGLLGLGVAALRSQGDARVRWTVWLALASCAFVVACLRIGTVQTFQVIASFGAVYLLLLIPEHRRALRIPAGFAISVYAFALVFPADRTPSRNNAQCTRPQDAASVARAPAGRLLAPVDEGAYLLAFTPHDIVAAPYHRNNAGNRIEAEAFTLAADDALQLLRKNAIDYVAICGTERRNAPLIAALVEGRQGVTPIESEGAYRLWRIER